MFRTLPTTGLIAAALALAAPPAGAAEPVAGKPKDIDLVLCLDVSNSMDGLIDSAKLKLWDVVNELAKVKPTPNLRVGLYSYGHTQYPREAGWVRKDLDLTTDLDEVYAKLNALKTNGGEEYVARVSKAALAEQKWSDRAGALKLVFVCGNEPATQDRAVNLSEVAGLAKEKGAIVNTIYCGSLSKPESAGWREFADQCGGKFAHIDQAKARRALAIATPYDKEIGELGGKLNSTYVAFGAKGKEGEAKQAAQDRVAERTAAGAAADRALSKAGELYRNSTWDLVDRMKEDPKFDLKQVKEEDLPDEMKKLKPEERLEYLKKKSAERDEIKKKIADLSTKRQRHIDEEAKKQPKTDGEKALDEALKGIIREQAAAKGFDVPGDKK
jgi:hypothetical protein